MSKAFTRESDDGSDLPSIPHQQSLLPPGAKNYMTLRGAEQAREELNRLVQVERPRIASATTDDGAKRQRQLLDQRILYLQQTLQSAVVVPPPVASDDRVRFGATVTVRDRGDGQSLYRIVGVSETDIDRGWVSWLSPIAKVLLNKRRGERVRFKFPSGEEELEIVEITYQ